MSIIIGEAYADCGVIMADTLLSGPNSGTGMQFSIMDHALKVHIISPFLCVALAGNSYDFGIEVIQRAISAANGLDVKLWPEHLEKIYSEMTSTGPDPKIDFMIGMGDSQGLSFAVVRNGGIVRTQSCWIGIQAAYEMYSRKLEEVIDHGIVRSGSFGPGAEKHIPQLEYRHAFSGLLNTRSIEGIGQVAHLGCIVTFNTTEGFRYPNVASIEVDEASGKNVSIALHSSQFPYAVAYFFSNLQKAWIFVSGVRSPKEFQCKDYDSCVEEARKRFGIQLIGSRPN